MLEEPELFLQQHREDTFMKRYMDIRDSDGEGVADVYLGALPENDERIARRVIAIAKQLGRRLR